MKKWFMVIAVLSITFALTAPAALADTFSYTYSDSSGVSATGTLTGNLVSSGEYLITSGTIDLSGAAACTNCGALNGPLDGNGVIDSPAPTGSFETGGGTNITGLDNLLLPGSDPALTTTGGLAFLMDDGLGVTIGANGPDNYGIFGGNWTLDNNYTGGGPVGDFTVTDITTTPEPTSLVLFGTGLLGMAFIAFRRKTAAAACKVAL